MPLNHFFLYKELSMMQELAADREAVERLLEQPNRFRRTNGTTAKNVPLRCPIPNITDEECYALASITPLLGVSDNCTKQSLTYLDELFNDNGERWAKKSKNFITS